MSYDATDIDGAAGIHCQIKNCADELSVDVLGVFSPLDPLTRLVMESDGVTQIAMDALLLRIVKARR